MSENRYAKDWSAYSQQWEARFGNKYAHLGEEWNDDQTPERKRDAHYFNTYAERFLQPNMTVLEVGPGGGKWTLRLAPRVRRLIVLDVVDEMLERTRTRCEALGLTNVDYILGSGADFQPVADSSIDFFFSHDVFVHIALEDTWPYTQEMARVLAPGGRGACHYAINTPPQAWDRIEQNNDWYRFGEHTLGQYYYYSPEALRRMYEHCGLQVIEQHLEVWNCVCVFQKPYQSLAPTLEQLLRRLISPDADAQPARQAIIAALRHLPAELEAALEPLVAAAEAEGNLYQRVEYASQIRRLWRGL